MTSDITRLLVLAQSVPKLAGQHPFKFNAKNSVAEVTAIAAVVVERGGVPEANAPGIAKTVANVTEGCLYLPKCNMLWWRHFEQEGMLQQVLVVFIDRPQEQEEGESRGNS